MAEKKRVLVACGTGIATSTVVAGRIEKEMARLNIPITITQCKASEVPAKAEGYDLVVATTFISDTKNVPVIQTVSFLTGIGIENDVQKILGYLQ